MEHQVGARCVLRLATVPAPAHPDSIKDTIARGVENGMLAYVGKKADGSYAPFHWNSSLAFLDVEISEDVFVIQREVAEAYKAGKASPPPTADGGTAVAGGPVTTPLPVGGDGGAESGPSSVVNGEKSGPAGLPRLVWSGEVPHQKWMNFYTKVLSKFAATAGLKLTIRFEVAPVEGVSAQKVQETKVALRELGLKDSLEDE